MSEWTDELTSKLQLQPIFQVLLLNSLLFE